MKGLKLEELGQSILEKVINSDDGDQDRTVSNPFYTHLVALSKNLQKINGKDSTNWTENQSDEIEGRIKIVLDDLKRNNSYPTPDIGPSKLFVEAYKILSYSFALLSEYKNKKFIELRKDLLDANDALKLKLEAQENITMQERETINGKITELVSQNYELVQQNESFKSKIIELQNSAIKESDFIAALDKNKALESEIQNLRNQILLLEAEKQQIIDSNSNLDSQVQDLKQTNLNLTSSEMNTTRECQRLIKLTNEQQSIIKEMEGHIVSLEEKANNTDAFNTIALSQDLANKDLKNIINQRNKLLSLVNKMNDYMIKVDHLYSTKPIEIVRSFKEKDEFHIASDVSITGLPESVRIGYDHSLQEAFVALVREYKTQTAQVKLLAGLSDKICSTISNSSLFVNQFVDTRSTETFKLPSRIRNEISRILSLPEENQEIQITEFMNEVSKDAGIAVQSISQLLQLVYRRLKQGANNSIELKRENDLLQQQLKHQMSLLEQEKASSKELREIIDTFNAKFESPIKVVKQKEDEVDKREEKIREEALIKLAKKVEEQRQVIKKLKSNDFEKELIAAKNTIEEQKLTILNLQQTQSLKADYDTKNFENSLKEIKEHYDMKIQKIKRAHDRVLEDMKEIKKNSIQALKSELELEREQRNNEKLKSESCIEDYKKRLDQALQTDAALKIALEKCTKELNETRLSLAEVRVVQKTTEARALAAQTKLNELEYRY